MFDMEDRWRRREASRAAATAGLGANVLGYLITLQSSCCFTLHWLQFEEWRLAVRAEESEMAAAVHAKGRRYPIRTCARAGAGDDYPETQWIKDRGLTSLRVH